MKTDQEMFDVAYRYHILEGNPLGTKIDEIYPNSQPGCSYLAKCFVGCQMTEEMFQEIRNHASGAWDSQNINSLYSATKMHDLLEAEFGAKRAFISDGQAAHDAATSRFFIKSTIYQNTLDPYSNVEDTPEVPEGVDSQDSHAVLKYNYGVVASIYDLTIPTE